MKTKFVTMRLLGVLLFLAPWTGYCFYNPSMGRWLSRDPRQEEGCQAIHTSANDNSVLELDSGGAANNLGNVYRCADNNAINLYDPLGLWPSSCPFLGMLIGGTPLTHQNAAARELPISGFHLTMVQLSDQEIDDKPYQEPALSYMHAMRDGKAGETSAHAKKQANDYVRENLSKAQVELCNGDLGSYLIALQYFGWALHPVQDSTSPAHNRRNGEFKPWYGVNWYNPIQDERALGHVLHENFDPGYSSHLDHATSDLWNKYFKCKKCSDPLPDNFFTYGVDRGWWFIN